MFVDVENRDLNWRSLLGGAREQQWRWDRIRPDITGPWTTVPSASGEALVSITNATSSTSADADHRRVRVVGIGDHPLPVAIHQQVRGFQRRLADERLAAQHEK